LKFLKEIYIYIDLKKYDYRNNSEKNKILSYKKKNNKIDNILNSFEYLNFARF
jgi:hypothetical protein